MRRLSDFDRQRLGDWIFGLTLNTWPDIEDPHRLTELLKILEQMRDADRDGQQINLNLLFGLSSGGSGAPKNHDSLRLWNLVMSWITADAICTGKSLESYLDVTQKLEVKGVLPGGTCDRSSFFRHLNNYRKNNKDGDLGLFGGLIEPELELLEFLLGDKKDIKTNLFLWVQMGAGGMRHRWQVTKPSQGDWLRADEYFYFDDSSDSSEPEP